MSEPKLCRLCFTEHEKCIEIFSERGKTLGVAAILAKHFWFQVNEHDEFSQNICMNCWTDTGNFHEFYTKIENIHEKINFEKTTSQINGKNCEEIKLEEPFVSMETLNYIDIDSFDRNKVHTMEKIEIFEDRTLEGIKLDAFENADDDLINITGDKDSSDFENEGDLSIKEVAKNSSVDKKKSSDESSDDSSKYEEEPRRRKKKKIPKTKVTVNNEDNTEAKGAAKIEQDDKQIREFVGMNCEMCDAKFVKFSKLLIHYDQIHQTGGYVTCCCLKFFRKERILEHIQRHLNPNEYKCHLCDKMFARKYALKSHIANHEPFENRKHKCNQCPSSFNKASILTTHIRQYHDERQDFLCDICKKIFTSKSNLAHHIRQVHEKVYAQVCDICAKVFTTRHALQNHQIEHSDNPRPKVQCNICGSWLKNQHNLQKHIKRHTDGVQLCKICNKPSQNSHALSSHMISVHGERTHKCSVCDKAFKKACVLKEHMALHTGQELYKCSYCPKTFRFNAAKYIHARRNHPEEWAQNRVNRYVYPKKTD